MTSANDACIRVENLHKYYALGETRVHAGLAERVILVEILDANACVVCGGHRRMAAGPGGAPFAVSVLVTTSSPWPSVPTRTDLTSVNV